MRRVSDFIVDHCYVIFVVFLVISGICGLLSTRVTINKDIYKYMPADSETSLGLSVMDDEFDYSSTSSYKMMLKGVPTDEKMGIKEDIEKIDGIESVDYDSTDNYNRDDYTLYVINLGVPADSESAAQIYKTIHDNYVQKYELAESGQVFDYNGDVLKISISLLAVASAMVILITMSKSWTEPFLFLFAILLAVAMNKGTNIIFPSVSHITDAISAILQMALSMDYAIMLSTRYRQEKARLKTPDKRKAMRRAMRYSFSAISSSSVTTVVGLVVLVLMSFTIGRDMGLVLSKGVILSLVSIFTTLPALLLFFDRAIEKTTKKTINLKMDWLGKRSYNLRHLALPIFLIIFAGSLILKGSTAIDFTSSQNDKIKDVFDEPNQIALVYDKKMDESVTDFCHKYDDHEDTKRVLCYGNTINEPEKYFELIPKVNELSSEEVKTEDYLVKAIYYHYYKNVDAHAISLDDFVKFLQNDVFPNEYFADELTEDIVSKVNRFSYFTDQNKVNQLRSKEEIASILGIEPSKLDEVYVLYFGEKESQTKLTLYQFARFVNDDILTNPKYASMITTSQRSDLAKLLVFSNGTITDAPQNAFELSGIFGINQSTIEDILTYYNYNTIDTPSATATVEELVNFALTDQNVLAELGLSTDEAATLQNQLANIKKTLAESSNNVQSKINQAISSLPEETQVAIAPYVGDANARIAAEISKAENVINQKYSYTDIENSAIKIDTTLNNVSNWLNNFEENNPELLANLDEETGNMVIEYARQIAEIISTARTSFNLAEKLSQLKNIYKLYQAKTTASITRLSPRNLVNFLIEHAMDDALKNSLSSNMLEQLRLVQFIMSNQSTRYSSIALSQTFNLDAKKLQLVYALYDYRYINPNPQLSLKTLINFINDAILPNQEYSSYLTENERIQLSTIASLMRSAEAGVQFNYDALYRAILPIADNFDKNKLFLAYLYHGSLYDYDEKWTLTLEAFANFLVQKVLPDERFSQRIDDEMCQKIIDGNEMINDAKELLVGPKHYRALIETNLPAEGERTFSFISELKEKLGHNNKVDYYLVGDSAMAYEIAQTFSSEMDFITIITMLAIFVVVFITFKSVFVSVLLVFVIQCAVYIVMAYLSLTGSSIFFIALIIVQAILMGATIDYAILFSSYYVENRSYFKLGIKESLISTYNKSIGAILTSASILIIVTAIVGNFTSAIAGKICKSISLGTFCATIIILILLPALLATMDKFIIKRK